MDNERRHELQHNELADQLDKAKTWIEPYVVPILIGVIAVTLIGIVVNFFQSQQSSSRSEATIELLLNTNMDAGAGEDADAYAGIADKFPGTAPGEIAAISKADIFLAQGIDALFRDRKEAEDRLKDAVTAYESVIATTKIDVLKSRATFGLAQALESQGKLKEATEAYENVIKIGESDQMTKVAESRIQMLARADTKAFAAWFAEQEPNAFAPLTPPGMPNASGLPGAPDFQMPALPPLSGDAPAESTENTGTLGSMLDGPLNSGSQPLPENTEFSVPDADAKPPTEDVPAEATPAEPAPTEPAPAEATPAEPAPAEPAPAEPTGGEAGEGGSEANSGSSKSDPGTSENPQP